MLVRYVSVRKWFLYGVATLGLLLLQGLVLRRITVWGVFPLLLPMLPAVLGSYEGPFPGAVYGLVFGVVCDLLFALPLPCFYTLLFPLVGLAAALIARGLLSTGFFCALLCSLAAFLLTDLFHILVLWLHGQTPWAAGLVLTARECLVSLPAFPVVMLLFSLIWKKCREDD